MTISGSGFNLPNLTPANQTPYEQQTSGQTDLKNAADMGRGHVVIVPQSQSADVSFVLMGRHNLQDYKAERDNPTLIPLMHLYGSGPDIKSKDEGDKAHFNNLFDHLPEDVKTMLAGLPTVYTAALKFVLDLAANALNWQDKAHVQSQTENALNRAEVIKKLPDASYKESLKLGQEIADGIETWMEKLGKNDPDYISTIDFVRDAKEILKGTTHAPAD